MTPTSLVAPPPAEKKRRKAEKEAERRLNAPALLPFQAFPARPPAVFSARGGGDQRGAGDTPPRGSPPPPKKSGRSTPSMCCCSGGDGGSGGAWEWREGPPLDTPTRRCSPCHWGRTAPTAPPQRRPWHKMKSPPSAMTKAKEFVLLAVIAYLVYKAICL